MGEVPLVAVRVIKLAAVQHSIARPVLVVGEAPPLHVLDVLVAIPGQTQPHQEQQIRPQHKTNRASQGDRLNACMTRHVKIDTATFSVGRIGCGAFESPCPASLAAAAEESAGRFLT